MTRFALNAEVGEKKKRRSRETGRIVLLIDAEAANEFNPDDGGRWITLCEEHGTFVQHETYHVAKSFLAAPSEWCETCAEVGPAEGAEERPVFSEEDREKALETRRRKAEEKRAREEEEKARQRAAKDAEAVLAEWALFRPILEAPKTEGERVEDEKMRAKMLAGVAGARKYRRELRDRVEELEGAVPPKRKREKELRELIPALEEHLAEAEEWARIARDKRKGIAAGAYLRAAAEAGYRVEKNGIGFVLAGPGDPVRIPDDYYPIGELALLASGLKSPASSTSITSRDHDREESR